MCMIEVYAREKSLDEDTEIFYDKIPTYVQI